MFIDDIHKFVEFLKNEGQNIYHTPEQINDVINRASFDLFRQEEKIFEKTQIVTDTLGAFKVKNIYTLVATGVYPLPSDYNRSTNLSFNSDNVAVVPIVPEDPSTFCDPDYTAPTSTSVIAGLENEIKILVDAEWINRQGSKIVPPDAANPIARINGRNLEVLPKTTIPILYYLKKPVKAIWAYTTSGDGYSTIFNPTGSVDLDWPEISHNEIIEKVMSLLGIPIKDTLLTQFEQLQKRNNNE